MMWSIGQNDSVIRQAEQSFNKNISTIMARFRFSGVPPVHILQTQGHAALFFPETGCLPLFFFELVRVPNWKFLDLPWWLSRKVMSSSRAKFFFSILEFSFLFVILLWLVLFYLFFLITLFLKMLFNCVFNLNIGILLDLRSPNDPNFLPRK